VIYEGRTAGMNSTSGVRGATTARTLADALAAPTSFVGLSSAGLVTRRW
jgi:hypothetical protein